MKRSTPSALSRRPFLDVSELQVRVDGILMRPGRLGAVDGAARESFDTGVGGLLDATLAVASSIDNKPEKPLRVVGFGLKRLPLSTEIGRAHV